MSIFGIPIPTIPISLSFGLAPAISQVFSNGGLVPIGRKGEAAKEKFSIDSSDEMLTDDDQTRGPDTQTPVWVDKFKNIDFKKLASLFPDSFPSKPKKKDPEVLDTDIVKRKINYNNYLEPNNPIIPLSGSKELYGPALSSGYFPQDAKSSYGGYFPVSSEEEKIPIIKFDHPIHPILPPDDPVLPPTQYGDLESAKNKFYEQILNEKLSTVSKSDLQKLGVGGGTGFQPMFIPASHDGNINNLPSLSDDLLSLLRDPDQIQSSPALSSAFPGIDATMKNEAIAGATETPRVNQPTPSIVIEEVPPYSSDYNYYYENKSPYGSIPEYATDFDDVLPDNTFFSRSTEKPASEKPKRTPDILDFSDITTNVLDFKEQTTTQYDPRKRNKNKQEAVDFVQNLLKEKNNLDLGDVITEMPPSTEMDIELDILHKGTPKHDQTTDSAEAGGTDQPQYEYEYEYVYYDDYDTVITTEHPSPRDDLDEDSTTTSKTSLKSLLSFLNKESTTFNDASEPSTSFPSFPATERPAIFQSSTIQYDMGDNYPELRRSTVTVEIEDDWSRSV